MFRAILISLLCALAGCAAYNHGTKAEAISMDDKTFIGKEITTYIAKVLPPASSTVWITTQKQAKDLIPVSLEAVAIASLRDSGFAVAEGKAISSGAHSLSFNTTFLESGVLVSVTIDQTTASRWYNRDANGLLVAASSFTVRAAQ